MESENVIRQQNSFEINKKERGSNGVVLVQLLVCAFVVLLIFIVGKVSPDTYKAIKEEYDKIMSVDMDTKDVVASVKDVITVVNASAHESVEFKEEKTEEKKDDKKDSAVAVMAPVYTSKGITVPVHGTITSRFGNRTNPISGAYTSHTGIDIAADSGTDIKAAYDGVVKSTGTEDKAGNYVKIEHSDGSETLYCHCSKLLVSEGDSVKAGDTVALVGSTGWSTGPHLHFEIHRDGERIDPLSVLEEKSGGV